MKRILKCPETEPDQKTFELPSEGEHLFQVTDVLDNIDSNPDVFHVKCEVVGGDEEGRTILNRLNLDVNFKGFFAVRLFLKAISLPHKGEIEIDTDDFIGRQFYADIVHNGQYANIKTYNFDKLVDQPVQAKEEAKPEEEVEWDAE